jgi:hypothetical protein
MGTATDDAEDTEARDGHDAESAPKPTGKQLLAWATGDRDLEASALAEQTAELTELTTEEALPAAKIAVADAHGDTGAKREADNRPSDVAQTSDVIAVARETDQEN